MFIGVPNMALHLFEGCLSVAVKIQPRNLILPRAEQPRLAPGPTSAERRAAEVLCWIWWRCGTGRPPELDGDVPVRDLTAPLTRRLMEISREIKAIDAWGGAMGSGALPSSQMRHGLLARPVPFRSDRTGGEPRA